MGKKPRQWSPDGLKYLMVINPFGWRNPPDGSSRNVAPGHLTAWVNHAVGYQQGDSVVQELAWRAKTGTREAILVGISESMDFKHLLGEHRWSEFCPSVMRPDSSYIFETKYESLAHACGADSWKRVESDLQPAVVGDMFERPYPRPHWADSRKQCTGMNAQVSAQVKAMPALPPSELQDIKPDPSVPLVAVYGHSGTGNHLHRPPRSAHTGSSSAQTSRLAQDVYPSPRGTSAQESFYVKQELSENVVHSSINVPRSISTLPNSPSTELPFSVQPDNRHSSTSHRADHAHSVSDVPGNGYGHTASLRLDNTAEPQIKVESSEASVGRMTAAYGAHLATRSAAGAFIPTATFTQALSPLPRPAQSQPSKTPFPADVPPPSSTPETPTTRVKTEPVGHTFELTQPPNASPLEPVVPVNRSSTVVFLPAAMFELTATLPSRSIANSEPEPTIPLTNLTPPSGTSPLTDRHSQLQGTPGNVTPLLNPSGIDESPLYTLLTPSSTLNKRKGMGTEDRDRKRAKLDDSSR